MLMKTLIRRIQKSPDGNTCIYYSIHVKFPSKKIIKALSRLSYAFRQLLQTLTIAKYQLSK